MYEQALTLFRQCTPPDERRMGVVLNNLGNISLDQGDLAAARCAYEESLVIRRRRDDPNLSSSIDNLANLAVLQGDFVTAQVLLDEGIPLAEHVGDTRNLNFLQRTRGLLTLEQGEAVATTQLCQVLENYQAANDPVEQINALQMLGYIALVEYRLAEADVWLHQAAILNGTAGPNGYGAEVALQRSRLALAQSDDIAAWTLVQEAIQLALVGGKRRLLPEVAEQAALLLLRQGIHEEACALWHTAAASRRTAGLPQLPSLRRWYGDQTAALVTAGTDLSSATLDDLSTLLAGVMPAALA